MAPVEAKKPPEVYWQGRSPAPQGTGEPRSFPWRSWPTHQGATCRGATEPTGNPAGAPAKLARKLPAGVLLNYLGSQPGDPRDGKLLLLKLGPVGVPISQPSTRCRSKNTGTLMEPGKSPLLLQCPSSDKASWLKGSA